MKKNKVYSTLSFPFFGFLIAVTLRTGLSEQKLFELKKNEHNR